MRYSVSPYFYQRRLTREVVVGQPQSGGVVIGGDNPVVIQSMITCNTVDTEACVKETLDLVAVGCQVVRITAPTVKDAANLKNIASSLRARGCQVPLVADIHFKPEAALEAARWVEKVRINPGNFADTKKFSVREYTEEEYAAELTRIEERFVPLVKLCRDLGRALRIGANHGSLSDRILNRFGDTPAGMVESALEFAQIARQHDFHNLVFSMKASNVKVMLESYRLLVARLEALGPDWNYPLHLGVTEAGEGEDGRIKSAVGIGSLLADGLGDTIRVSLTEDSPQEIPVGRELLAQIPPLTRSGHSVSRSENRSEEAFFELSFDPFSYQRRMTTEVDLGSNVGCGGEQTIRVVVTRRAAEILAPQIKPRTEVKPEAVYENVRLVEWDPAREALPADSDVLVTVKDGLALPVIAAFRWLACQLKRQGKLNPILLKDTLWPEENGLDSKAALLRSSLVIGGLLADGIGDAILVRNEANALQSVRLAFNILQAVGSRSFKTEYVACPSCGRTLFHLQTVTARIKCRTQHLKGVKIAIMGCIVNGPGEMADADFGYVGGAPGKVNLYRGKKAVKFNIPEADAVDCLVDLIREHGKWVAPE